MDIENKRKVEELARQLGTYIPGDIPLDAWALPILEVLAERVQVLGKELDTLGEKISALERMVFRP